MRYLLVVIFFLSYFVSDVAAQEKHFVFIQSDNNQPFYFSLNGKLFSSGASGYLIVPKLDNGNYYFSIGFAKDAYPEQSFKYSIDNKDVGFVLKNFGDKGFGLFNLQSMDVTMGETAATDDISRALSEKNSVKDNADPVISFNRTKKAPIKPKAQAKLNVDSVNVPQEPVAQNGNKNTEVAPDAVIDETKREDNTSASNNEPVSGITKVSESKVDDGVHLSYVDNEGKKGDTVNVIIPSNQATTDMAEGDAKATEDAVEGDSPSAEASLSETSSATKDSLKFLDINTDKSKKDNDADVAKLPEYSTTHAISNSKCKDVATDNDYTRLRRKMAGETTDEKMINVAKKAYRNKCFTTDQIKRLSTLFLSDEGRYNFFNASYNSVSDVGEYSTLQSEFIDPSFTDRFKAMLK